MSMLIDPERITYARELKGFSKKDLAQKVDKTPSAISQIEKSIIRPDTETLMRISLALSVPPSFFAKKEGRRYINLGQCHFRSKRSVSQAKRKQSVRIGDFFIEFVDFLQQQGVVFPEEKVSGFQSFQPKGMEDIEIVAAELRRSWGMSLGPIPNITRLLESKGIIVTPIYNSCTEVDAFSVWAGKRPWVMLALGKTASRARFDAAHELGHLVLHEEHTPGCSLTENEADRFAGAFLAPRDSFILECPRRWDYEAFEKLKLRWKMSIQALVYRAYNLGVLSQHSLRKAFISISQSGQRKDEGTEWAKEQPTLFNQALELICDKVSLNEIASTLCVSKADLIGYLNDAISEDLLTRLDKKSEDQNGQLVFLRES
jgi:Zn-dependent peptidase ImmA (M78 family)/transcriptional regulator with XRE-family HTH domain